MRRGFTLVELLAVLAIFSLLTIIILPSVNRLKDRLLVKTAASLSVSNLRRGQALALATSGQAECKTISPILPGVTAPSAKSIIFTADGYTLPGGSGTLVLNIRSGKPRKVIISSAGRVRGE
ncbi:MAG: type II secretion system GspH family protein [Candidatus Margulisbacteria bacterium]|nr:type II secretion system GspH family protein [Candidatus Margulisiibacteriota bacterium]MBU1867490.1 type II secretion system GspH family protein [Candidatus Margulisiibacteriota bacterium]